MNINWNTSRLPRIALVGAAVASALCLAPSASAVTPKIIDYKTIVHRLDAGNGVRGWSTETLTDGRIQARLHLTVERSDSGPDCLFTWVTLHYADGTQPTVKNSPRACEDESNSRTFDIPTATNEDLVRYSVQLRAATDTVSDGTVVSGSTYFVGRVPDSYGTKDQLDKDTITASTTKATVWNGRSYNSVVKYDYPVAGLTGWTVRSRVEGTFGWHDSLPGTKAYLWIQWTYADGSIGDPTKAATITRGQSVNVVKTSDQFKDVWQVKVFVTSTDNSSAAPQATTRTVKFGDYNTE